jgi:hypothetical protein
VALVTGTRAAMRARARMAARVAGRIRQWCRLMGILLRTP